MLKEWYDIIGMLLLFVLIVYAIYKFAKWFYAFNLSTQTMIKEIANDNSAEVFIPKKKRKRRRKNKK